MRFSPPDDDVDPYNTVFDDDLLGRKKVSERLSGILERIEDPLVIALDGQWGTGKTYFLKRWVGAHTKQNRGRALTVYFDAFAHDYHSDPLIALVGALLAKVPAKEKGKKKGLMKAASKFIKPVARIGLAVATYGGTEAVGAAGDVVIKAVQGEASKAMDAFWEKEQGRQVGMDEFRAAIEKLTDQGKDKPERPLVIVIDELDRCRPDYALEVLEVIKHFFAVPHVHFVLGVNLSALENSVKVRYGADIDATAYLQKFVSFSLSLPNHIGDHDRTPAILRYVTHLGKVMETPRHILEKIQEQLIIVSKCNPVSIRDVGRIMSTVSLLPEAALNKGNLWGWSTAIVTLIITRVIRPKLFQKMVDSSISEDEIVTYFGVAENRINQYNSEKIRNAGFDRELAILYSTWCYISQSKTSIKHDFDFDIARAFNQFGDARKIPEYIFDNWLSDYNIT